MNNKKECAYGKINNRVTESYQSTLRAVRQLCSQAESGGEEYQKKDYFVFLNKIGKWILMLAEYEKRTTEEYFVVNSLEQLLKENHELYCELLGENYELSYANPSYCKTIFGDKLGQLMSWFYCIYRGYIEHAFCHRIYKLEEYNGLFLQVYNYIEKNEIEYNVLKCLMVQNLKKGKTEMEIIRLREKYDKNYNSSINIVEAVKHISLHYLFKYGRYIADNEIKMAEFLRNYPEEKLKQLSKCIIDAYIKGFRLNSKEIGNKTTVCITYHIGMEKLVYQLLEDLKKHGLEAVVCGIYSTEPNKQYSYDHRFDNALYLDKEWVEAEIKSIKEACGVCKEALADICGNIILESFGEEDFIPQQKDDCLELNDEQIELLRLFEDKTMQIYYNEYIPDEETSFTMIAFPLPEIGYNFEDIFEAVIEVNMLEDERHEQIQQKIIDCLDLAEYVQIKGKEGNLTDITIRFKKLKNPDKETNFQNVGADVNIPAGEVFTTPEFEGTTGIIHIEEAYIEGLKYNNLIISFKDGYVDDYMCSNYDEKEENRNYIRENLLNLFNTVPIGEFAIGTNTMAYVTAQKYKIINKLPILIAEKMGPHIALGDTCFAGEEEVVTYNRLDGKEIVAKDNKKSIKRNVNMDEAYYNMHADITLPYELVKLISAVDSKGHITNIIENGRFVLEGTEELNQPFAAL